MNQKVAKRKKRTGAVRPNSSIPRASTGYSAAISRVADRKRSDDLKLTIMKWGAIGTVAAVILWPEAESGVVLTSIEDCRTPLTVSRAQCESAYQAALLEHERLAPRFEDEQQCWAEFGSCSRLDAYSSHWIPSMAGFLVGYQERDDDDAQGSSGGGVGLYRYNGSLPLYRDRAGDYLNPRGEYVRTGAGKVTGSAGKTHAPARAVTISRSGFGSSASARTSFGG